MIFAFGHRRSEKEDNGALAEEELAPDVVAIEGRAGDETGDGLVVTGAAIDTAPAGGHTSQRIK